MSLAMTQKQIEALVHRAAAAIAFYKKVSA